MTLKIDLLQPAKVLSDHLRSGGISSAELLSLSIDQLDRLNPALNAVVSLDLDRARADADASDARRALGQALGPLDGLPVTIKDSIATEGHITTSGHPSLANYVPAEDAVAVHRLRSAGAVIFGKTNLPAFAADLQTDNGLFGRTANPWDLARGPGGSSGGSAAAVATGISALDVGSDIGGSVRTPAHYCGIFAHKPTFEVYPQRGHIPPPPGYDAVVDMGTLGPIARAASDLRLAFDVLVTPTVEERVNWAPNLLEAGSLDLRTTRVAIWSDDPLLPVDDETRDAIDALGSMLEAGGAIVDRVARPAFDLFEAIEAYLTLLFPLFGAGYDAADLTAFESRAARSGPEAARYLNCIIAGRVRSLADYAAAKEVQARCKRVWSRFFEQHDFLICPVAPTAAFPHQEDPMVFARTIAYAGQIHAYWDQFLWCGALGNFAHLPATVRPLALSNSGLPIGVQIMGPAMSDRRTIAFAELLDAIVPPIGFPPITKEIGL